MSTSAYSSNVILICREGGRWVHTMLHDGWVPPSEKRRSTAFNQGGVVAEAADEVVSGDHDTERSAPVALGTAGARWSWVSHEEHLSSTGSVHLRIGINPANPSHDEETPTVYFVAQAPKARWVWIR